VVRHDGAGRIKCPARHQGTAVEHRQCSRTVSSKSDGGTRGAARGRSQRLTPSAGSLEQNRVPGQQCVTVDLAHRKPWRGWRSAIVRVVAHCHTIVNVIGGRTGRGRPSEIDARDVGVVDGHILAGGGEGEPGQAGRYGVGTVGQAGLLAQAVSCRAARSGEHGNGLLRRRGELLERSFAHAYETGRLKGTVSAAPESSPRRSTNASSPSSFMPRALLAALSFLQELDHRGGSNNPGGFVLFQGKEFLVAGHEELGLAGFSQREQVAVLGVRLDRAGG